MSDNGFEVGDLVRGKSTGTMYRITSSLKDGSHDCEVLAPGDNLGGRDHYVGRIVPNKPRNLTLVQSINTNTKENTDMNDSSINAAIQAERADEARKLVKPYFRAARKLVKGTKVGEGIVTWETEGDNPKPPSFYFRTTENEWEYGNGTAYKTSDEVIDLVTQRTVAGEQARRLVVEDPS